jgi:large subunit ribosomal protein L10
MVSEKKKQEVEEIREMLGKYSVIGILDFFKMPSRQLQSIRKGLRGKALIRMCKKRIMVLALKNIKGKGNVEKLNELEVNEPALIFTDMDPFKLFKILKKNKSPDYARVNDITKEDIVVRAGPTNLMAGPAIGELQRVKIPAMVKEGKIHIREDVVVVKKGEIISEHLANVLKKLDIQPMEVGISLLGVWENGVIYGRKVLDVDEKEFIQNIRNAYFYALNLSVNICYFNKESIKMLIQKAYEEGRNLGINANILGVDIVGDLIKKANIQANNLKMELKI